MFILQYNVVFGSSENILFFHKIGLIGGMGGYVKILNCNIYPVIPLLQGIFKMIRKNNTHKKSQTQP